jgi:hypothetical protein
MSPRPSGTAVRLVFVLVPVTSRPTSAVAVHVMRLIRRPQDRRRRKPQGLEAYTLFLSLITASTA